LSQPFAAADFFSLMVDLIARHGGIETYAAYLLVRLLRSVNPRFFASPYAYSAARSAAPSSPCAARFCG
jgi:hypothetical protein